MPIIHPPFVPIPVPVPFILILFPSRTFAKNPVNTVDQSISPFLLLFIHLINRPGNILPLLLLQQNLPPSLITLPIPHNFSPRTLIHFPGVITLSPPHHLQN